MPTLAQSLQGHDLGYLRIVAEAWGLEFNAPDARVGLSRLAPLLLERKRIEETVNDLSSSTRLALDDLLQHEGRLSWPLFTRRYGSVREMGPGRRDRERPYAKSASPAEILWYRALVARAFFDGPNGPEEFAYIPDDLLALLPPPRDAAAAPLGRPATSAERAYSIPAVDCILDHATTLLAALRVNFSPLAEDEKTAEIPTSFLQQLLAAAGFLDANAALIPEPTRAFLESPRGEALAQLARTWLHSETFNNLRLIPGLETEGEWQNNPLRARQVILDFLSTVPPGAWWNLAAFVAAVRQHHPDFQRPAGDYDSWFIRSTETGEFLRGFEHWDAVDGALIQFVITGPLHWLGITDLAAPTEAAPPAAFRYSSWSTALLSGALPEELPAEDEKLKIGSDARLRVPRLVPRAVRYQIARFCEWEDEDIWGKMDAYRYRLTPFSLARARQQGLIVGHLLALLRRHADVVPPTLVKALERWDQHGSEVRVERLVVLRLSSPDLLQAVRASRAARFLGEPLGATAIIVKPGAWKKVQAVLAEMGYLGESALDEED